MALLEIHINMQHIKDIVDSDLYGFWSCLFPDLHLPRRPRLTSYLFFAWITSLGFCLLCQHKLYIFQVFIVERSSCGSETGVRGGLWIISNRAVYLPHLNHAHILLLLLSLSVLYTHIQRKCQPSISYNQKRKILEGVFFKNLQISQSHILLTTGFNWENVPF